MKMKNQNKKKTNLDMGMLIITGIMSVIVTFSLLIAAAIITDTDIVLWDKTKAIPAFFIISGGVWWYFLSSDGRKEYKRLKKA